MIITAFNPDISDNEKTYLSTLVTEGSTTLPVKNNDRFVSGNRVLIGGMGAENAELATLNSVASDKLSLGISSATSFDHNSNEPVYALEYDQIRFYRADSETGTYTAQTTVDIDVDNADKMTRWDDTTAVATNFYKIAFYNSVTTVESDLSDPVQASGYQRKNIGAIVDGVVRRVRDTGFTVLSFEEYMDIANEVGDDLITQAMKPYAFLKRSVELDTVVGKNYIDILSLVPDFWKFDYVEIDQNTYGSNTNYKEVTPLSIEQWNQRYSNTSLAGSDMVSDVAIDDRTKRLYIYPTPKTARSKKIILHYYKTFTELKTSGDTIETPNPTIYRYKLMAEFYSAKAEVDKQWITLSEKYENKYGNEVVKMQRVNRLDVGTPRSFRSPRAYRRRRYTL